MKRATTCAMAAMLLWTGVAWAGGMGGRPVARQGHGQGGAVVVGPGSTVNQGPVVHPAPGYRLYPSYPYYPPARPYPYAGVYPYQYSQPYSSHPFAGGYPAARYPAPVYPVYVNPGYSTVIVDQSPAYWVSGYWAQQWVPVYSMYQVWCPPYYDQRGLWIEGRWEDRTVENGGYYDRVWVEGHWAR